jgi:long-subunit acyl-CoA synthetase (AMP-forming)
MDQTVIQQLERTALDWGPQPAMKAKRAGVWESTSWSDYRDEVLQAARALLSLGLQPGDGVVIMGFNRPEWFVADLAAIAAGGVPAGIYITNTAAQCRYIAHHCEARIAVLENCCATATSFGWPRSCARPTTSRPGITSSATCR